MTARNTTFEALLTELNFTYAGLAAEINKVVEDLTGAPGICTERVVQRWVSGQVRWPRAKYRRAMEGILGRPAQALGFVPRGATSANLPAPPRRPPAMEEEGEDVHRRRFMTASAAATVVATLGIDQIPAKGRLSMSDIARIRQSIDRLDAHFFAIGAGPLASIATAHVAQLREALQGCTYGERVEKALHGAISSLCASAGWACHDNSDMRQAALLHADSLQSALLAADPLAVARAWSDLALQARREGRHREAVQIAKAALANRRASSDPRIACLLHARLAIGQARIGEPAAAARSLLNAEKAFDRIPDEPAPTWLRFLTAAELSGLAAITHRALGSYGDAQAATVQALQLLPPAMRRNGTYYRLQLAELQLAQGEREQAAATIATINTTSLASPRITDRLAAARRAILPHP